MVTYMEVLKEMVYSDLEYDQCVRRIKVRREAQRRGVDKRAPNFLK